MVGWVVVCWPVSNVLWWNLWDKLHLPIAAALLNYHESSF